MYYVENNTAPNYFESGDVLVFDRFDRMGKQSEIYDIEVLIDENNLRTTVIFSQRTFLMNCKNKRN